MWGGIDNNVYWFQICENVYAREQFEKPNITKEGGRKVDMYMVDRYFEPKTESTRRPTKERGVGRIGVREELAADGWLGRTTRIDGNNARSAKRSSTHTGRAVWWMMWRGRWEDSIYRFRLAAPLAPPVPFLFWPR